MKLDAYITKGTRVRVQRLKAQPMGTYSLAGAQMKVAATEESFEGVVRHIWADDPAGTKNLRFQIEKDDGTLEEVPVACVVGVAERESLT